MRYVPMVLVGGFLIACGWLLGADFLKQQAVRRERGRLVGTWVVTSAKVNGKPFPRPRGKKVIFAGEEMKHETDAGGFAELTYRVNVEHVPAKIDILSRERDKSGKQRVISRGIYRLDGDVLTLCVGPSEFDLGFPERPGEKPGEKRPASFEATPSVLLILRREGT
jgi:uncharacterized protein (TIGR03067 family)